MIHTIMSIVLIAAIVAIAFGLTWLAIVMLANNTEARQDRQERARLRGRGQAARRDEPPAQFPDSAKFKRGA